MKAMQVQKENLQSATAELSSLRTRRASLQQQIQLMGINPGSGIKRKFKIRIGRNQSFEWYG